MEKRFLIFLFLFAILTYGCSQQTATLDQQVGQPNEETEQIIEEPKPSEPILIEKCPDSVCDEFEKANKEACPEDCKNVEGWQEKAQQQPGQPVMPQQGPPERTLSVNALQSSYKTVTSKPSGWFKTGQDADIMLSGTGFNNAGGPLQFNHPGAVATDGKRIIVADTYNDRLLIWNSFPASNGQPADIEIKDAGQGQDVNPKRAMEWPWAVWTDGEKLVATATRSAKVLIWNTFPTKNNQPADISLALPDSFGTPRTIGSDSEHLIVGDHNIKVKGKEGQGNFFWKDFPMRDNQPYDFLISSAEEAPIQSVNQNIYRMSDIFWGPTFTSDGKLIALGNQLYIWNYFPENENDMPDVSVAAFHGGLYGNKLASGDGSGITIADGKLYISLYNGNKIVAYNSIPRSSEQNPDFVVGSPDLDTNTLDNVGFITNPVIETDGKSLFISSDFDVQ